MPRYIISIGSNITEGESEVNTAIASLAGCHEIVSLTPTYRSPDIHGDSRPPYTNAIAIIESDIDTELLNLHLKEYEKSRGRVAGSSEVIIDLDLVCRDDLVLRQRDYNAPYFVKGLYLLGTGKLNR